MDVVRALLCCAIGALTTVHSPVTSASARMSVCGTDRWESSIVDAATRFDLPATWLRAIMRVESAGCDVMNGRPIVSTAGAVGLMQLMPNTWAEYRRKLDLGSDPHDPNDNILAAAAHLRDLHNRFGWPGAAAAYHAGQKRYSDYLSSARPLPKATIDYLSRVERRLAEESIAARSAGPPATSGRLDTRQLEHPSVERPVADSAVAADTTHATREGLFVPLRHRTRSTPPEPQAQTDVQTQ